MWCGPCVEMQSVSAVKVKVGTVGVMILGGVTACIVKVGGGGWCNVG